MAKKKRMGRKRKVTPKKLRNAIQGTGGNKTLIARKLDVIRNTIVVCLAREGKGWDKARRAYNDECEKVADSAESTVQEMIGQRSDINLAASTARWYLSIIRQKYKETKTLHLKADVNAHVKVQQRMVVAVEELPLDLRRQIMKAIEKKEKKKKGK